MNIRTSTLINMGMSTGIRTNTRVPPIVTNMPTSIPMNMLMSISIRISILRTQKLTNTGIRVRSCLSTSMFILDMKINPTGINIKELLRNFFRLLKKQ